MTYDTMMREYGRYVPNSNAMLDRACAIFYDHDAGMPVTELAIKYDMTVSNVSSTLTRVTNEIDAEFFKQAYAEASMYHQISMSEYIYDNNL